MALPVGPRTGCILCVWSPSLPLCAETVGPGQFVFVPWVVSEPPAFSPTPLLQVDKVGVDCEWKVRSMRTLFRLFSAMFNRKAKFTHIGGAVVVGGVQYILEKLYY